jgi:hypothetical protein
MASGVSGYTVGTLEGPGTLADRPIARELPVDELSDTKIRNATPADKEYAIADGQGLSIVVRPNGTKLWLYRYRFGGRPRNPCRLRIGKRDFLGGLVSIAAFA